MKKEPFPWSKTDFKVNFWNVFKIPPGSYVYLEISRKLRLATITVPVKIRNQWQYIF